MSARLYTRREYLTFKALFLVTEVVAAAAAIEHPEWDMDETRTWYDWEAES